MARLPAALRLGCVTPHRDPESVSSFPKRDCPEDGVWRQLQAA